MSAFIYDYGENPSRNLPGWLLCDNPRVLEEAPREWRLDADFLTRLSAVLSEARPMCAELFFPKRKKREAYGLKPILVFKGTSGIVTYQDGSAESSLKHDIANIFAHVVEEESEYLNWVLAIANLLNERPGFDFVITGHSFGGRLAAAASRLTNRDAIIFNAAGLTVERLRLPPGPVDGKVAHYFVRGDILTCVQDDLWNFRRNPEVQSILRQHLKRVQPFLKSRWSGEWKDWSFLTPLFVSLMKKLETNTLIVPPVIEDERIPLGPRPPEGFDASTASLFEGNGLRDGWLNSIGSHIDEFLRSAFRSGSRMFDGNGHFAGNSASTVTFHHLMNSMIHNLLDPSSLTIARVDLRRIKQNSSRSSVNICTKLRFCC
jgi:hypothetical protein